MPTLTTITGYLYDAMGVIVRRGTLTLRLQQDLSSVDGTKIVPFSIAKSLAPSAVPAAPTVTTVGTAGTTTYVYEVSAVDVGGQTLVGPTGTVVTGNAALTGVNYNHLAWAAIPYAVTYNIYGRTTGIRTLLASTAALSYNDIGTAPIGTVKPTVDSSGGYISLAVAPTIGALPAGVGYFVEYDPDPADTTQPSRNKDGYWNNYWAVPVVASIDVGAFPSANRGVPIAQLQLNGATDFGDLLRLGSPSTTNKRVIASQLFTSPEIRYNNTAARWELSNDGVIFSQIDTPLTGGDIRSVVAGTGLTGGGLTGDVTLNIAPGQAKPAWLTLIDWSIIDRTTSSLLDLTTRSASDLNTGTLPDARFPATLPLASGVNLTNLTAANLIGTLPALSGVNLTNLTAANLIGTLPALSAVNLTSIPAARLVIASQAIGDLLVASSTTAFARLADVAAGQVLVSGGIGVAPAWSGSPSISGTLSVLGNVIASADVQALTVTVNSRITAGGYIRAGAADSTAPAAGDLVANRGGIPGSGAVMFGGSANLHYLFYTGTGFTLTDPLSVTGKITGSGDIQAATTGYIGFQFRAWFNAPADGQLDLTNSNTSSGIGFDFATDNVLKIRNRAQTAYADLTAQNLTATASVGANNVILTATSGYLSFGGHGYLQSVADAQWKLINQGLTAGVGLDFSTDGVLKIRTRAQTANAALVASTMTVDVAGVHGFAGVSNGLKLNGTSTAIVPADGGAYFYVAPGGVYVNSAVLVMANGGATQTTLRNNADGVLGLTNGANTDFGRLQFGGTTASYPALKRAGAGISVRLADDSAEGTLNAGVINIGTPGTPFSVGLRVMGAGANVADFQSSGATTNIYISPTGYDRWAFGAGQIGTNDFGFSNSTQGTVPFVISGGATGGQTMLTSAAGVQLQFGGRTSSFPALKRSGAFLQARLADDSGFAEFFCNNLTMATGGSVFSTGRGGVTFESDGVLNLHNEANTARVHIATNGLQMQDSDLVMVANGAGVLFLANYAQTTFNKIQFGGTTASFPALARAGAGLQVRLADNSGWGNLAASDITSNGPNGFQAADNAFFYWATRSAFRSPADGIITISNNATTDFGRLQFGGTSASFPALKRSGTAIQIRLADDSNYGDFAAGTINGANVIASAYIYWVGKSLMASPVNGDILLTNNGLTDFGKLQFGGQSAAFPALKRSGAILQVRLADDSGFARIQGIVDAGDLTGSIPAAVLPIAGITIPTRGMVYADNVTIAVDANGRISSLSGGAPSGTFLATDGAVATPSNSFVSDGTTGSYRIGASNVGYSAGGVLRWDYNTTRMNLSSGYALAVNGPQTISGGSLGFSGSITGQTNKVLNIGGTLTGVSPAGIYYTTAITCTDGGSFMGLFVNPSYITPSTGVVPTVVALYLAAPQITLTGSSTVTDASTVQIDGAPSAGTNRYALRVINGLVDLGTGGIKEGGALNLAVTSTDGLLLQNTTAATVGVPVQMSPRIRLRANVWNSTATAANNTDDWWLENLPISSTAPTGSLRFGHLNQDGAGNTYPLAVSSGGMPILLGTIPSFGANYAGIWVAATPSSTNWQFIGSNGQTLFNVDGSAGTGDIEFRVSNVSRAAIGTAGLSINHTSNAAPTLPFEVNDSSRTNVLFTVSDIGVATVSRGGIAAVASDGLVLQNATAATAGIPVQQPPQVTFVGNVWNTGTPVNQQISTTLGVVPLSSGTNVHQFQINTTVPGVSHAGGLPDFNFWSNGNTARLDINGSFQTIGGAINVGANAFFYFAGRSVIASPANGQLNLTDNAQGIGIGFDVNTDGVLKIRTRAQSAWGALTSGAIISNANSGGTAINIVGRNNAGADEGYLQFFKNDGTTLEGSVFGISSTLKLTGPAGVAVVTVADALVTFAKPINLTPGTAPASTEGNLYYDSTAHAIKVHNGTAFVSVATPPDDASAVICAQVFG